MTRSAKKFTLAVAAAALILAVPAAARNLPYQESVRETFPLSPGGVFALQNVNGSVTIEAWDGSEVVIEAQKRSDSQACLAALRLEFDATPRRVFVKAHFPDSRCREDGPRGEGRGQTEVEFNVRVPRFAQLDEVRLVNGALLVAGVEGGVKASSVNGKVTGRRLTGSVSLSTVNGVVEGEFPFLSSSDQVDLRSVNGAVRLSLATGVGARVKAATTNGSIRNDAGLPVTRGRYVGSTMEGQIGNGAAEISLRTVNGAINVSVK